MAKPASRKNAAAAASKSSADIPAGLATAEQVFDAFRGRHPGGGTADVFEFCCAHCGDVRDLLFEAIESDDLVDEFRAFLNEKLRNAK